MKYTYINKKWALAFTVAALLFSCKKTLDINEDPNNPGIEKATPEVLFPSAVLSTVGMIGGQLAVVGGIWAQYFTQSAGSSQFRDIDAYNVTNTTEQVNLPYEELFAGALADYQLAIAKSKESKDYRYLLMNTVMKAYTYEVLVDLYDKVPYTEAFQGQSNLQPKFDDGRVIYNSLLAEIDTALNKDFTSVAFTDYQKKTDIVFGGNMSNWVKFANTLKLKMFLRMLNVDPAAAQGGITALFNANAPFLDVTAGVAIFEGVPDRSNPMYEYNIRRLNTTTNIRASVTLSSYLVANEDSTRAVAYFGAKTPTAIHQGDYAATLAEQPTYGNASVLVQTATDPVHFISAAESYFMQAEALERFFGGVSPNANLQTSLQMYDLGVSEAYKQAGLTAADRPDQYDYPIAGTLDSKLTAIITQKWISFVTGSHELEGFFEQNRTGIPAVSTVYSTNESYIPGQFVYGKNGITGGKLPERFPFPDYEKSRNANTPAEVPITTKVWWAK